MGPAAFSSSAPFRLKDHTGLHGGVLLLVAALAFAGCDDADGSVEPEPGPGPGGEPEVVIDSDAMELCIAYTKMTSTLSASFATAFQPRLSCEAIYEDTLSAEDARANCDGSSILADFETAFSGGRVQINMPRARRCLSRSRALRADGARVADYNASEGDLFDLGTDADCTGIFVGSRNESDACIQHWDCVDGLVCQAAPPDGDLRCIRPALEDQVCGGSRSCADELTCVAGYCAGKVAIGRPCVLDDAPCVDGGFCDLTSSVPIEVYTCVAFATAGEDCSQGQRCGAGTACANDVCETVLVPGDGETCLPAGPNCDDDCAVCRASAFGGDTTCQPRGPVGDACAETDHCRTGLFCAPDTNDCQPLRGPGDECFAAFPCEDNLFCGPASLCVPRGDTLDACATDQECSGGLFCSDAGQCRQMGGHGDACGEVGPCSPNLRCIQEFCRDGRDADRCLTNNINCQVNLLCVVDGPDCDPNDAECNQLNIGNCLVGPVAGETCAGRFNLCAAGFYCPDGDVCVDKLVAGITCDVDDHCVSGECLEGGTCATPAASCIATRESGLVMLLFGSALPIFGRLRRRRRDRRPQV